MENIDVAPVTVTVAPAVADGPVTSIVPADSVNVPPTVNVKAELPGVIIKVPAF